MIIGTDANACYAERIDAIIKCQGPLMNFGGMISHNMPRIRNPDLFPLRTRLTNNSFVSSPHLCISHTVEIKSLLKPIISVEEVPGYSIRCPILHVDECTGVLICWCLCVAALAPPSYYLFFLLSSLPHSGIPPFNHDHEGPSNDIPLEPRRDRGPEQSPHSPRFRVSAANEDLPYDVDPHASFYVDRSNVQAGGHPSSQTEKVLSPLSNDQGGRQNCDSKVHRLVARKSTSLLCLRAFPPG
ncbi:hypothetical protein Syun_012766 [Stephania yunnanensis]|uniref:Uncharacterized protein n=1 Tax=Stephania yunnanensis TaxID=152371 RepID=A0AAP0PJS2_9MAGN